MTGPHTMPGLVGVLRELHDEMDAAVSAAYGWPAGLSEEEILETSPRSTGSFSAKSGKASCAGFRSAGALVLIHQSKPNECSLDPHQGHAVVGGGDHLLKYLRGCFEQAIQFRIVALSTSVR